MGFSVRLGAGVELWGECESAAVGQSGVECESVGDGSNWDGVWECGVGSGMPLDCLGCSINLTTALPVPSSQDSEPIRPSLSASNARP